MWRIALVMIFVIGLIVKNCNWSNILTKYRLRRNYRETHGFNGEYDGYNWNGSRWFDAYDLHE